MPESLPHAPPQVRFRLQRDVLSKGPIDLFFLEFAVNDDQDAGHSYDECIRGMEGIIRQVRNANPCTDIVVTYFVNPKMLKQIQGRQTCCLWQHMRKFWKSTKFPRSSRQRTRSPN